MTFPADFVDAHRRHWRDAELLFVNERWANSDQLYGFSAECGLKAVMVALGMPLDSQGGPSESRFRKHVHELWSEFCAFMQGRHGFRYLRMIPRQSPFSTWSHHQRYAAESNFSMDTTVPHRLGAERVRRMVQLAEEDSLW